MGRAMGASAGRGIRVLVIEDDASLNEIVCTFLTQEGFACTPAFSGSEARLLLAGTAGAAGARREPADNDPGVDAAGADAEIKPPQATDPVNRPFDLVITDLMLPGLPGEQLVPLARRCLGNVPVMVTSAKSAVADRVTLLRTGADDYLVKPFDLDELLARIEVQLRLRNAASTEALRVGNAAHGASAAQADAAFSPTPSADGAGDTTPGGPSFSPATRAANPDALAFGAWQLDPIRRSFTVNGAPLKLTRTEFDLAAALMRQPERVFSKRDLYLAACHNNAAQADAAAGALASDEKTVSTHIGNLRAKLKPTGTDGYIETVWGIGFKLKSPRA